MSEFSRRDALKVIGATAISTATGSLLGSPCAQAADLSYKPEAGAQLRVLRWKRFVQGDEDQWAANTRKFTQLTGVPFDFSAWHSFRNPSVVDGGFSYPAAFSMLCR